MVSDFDPGSGFNLTERANFPSWLKISTLVTAA
jgi:hypothetical protein